MSLLIVISRISFQELQNTPNMIVNMIKKTNVEYLRKWLLLFKFNFNGLIFSPVQFVGNIKNFQYQFEKVDESRHFAYIHLKFFFKSLNKSFFIHFSPLSSRFSNHICDLAGYENFHSIQHLKILKNISRILFVDDFIFYSPLV